MRRALASLAAAAAMALATTPVWPALPGASEPIARVEAYLNSIDTLRSSFVQINPDGGQVTGEMYYARPDKMRLQYDPPSGVVIVADQWQMLFYDGRLKQESRLLTGQTPLGFLLSDEIELDGDVTVTGVEEAGGELRITLVRTDEPGQGSITLVFAEQPLELRRWTVVDAQGLPTHVVLDGIETGVALDDELFVFRNRQFDPGRRSDR